MQNNALSYANSRGSFSFGGLLTSGFDCQRHQPSPTPASISPISCWAIRNPARCASATPTTISAAGPTTGTPRTIGASARGLTLNLGLRYEYFTPYTELHGHLANLDVNPALTAGSVVTAGSMPAGPIPASFPPAWSIPTRTISRRASASPGGLRQKHSRVIRGGYSIFFSGSAYSQIATTMAAQPPFANTASLSTSLADPLTLQNGFPPGRPNTITNTYAIDPNYKLAYAQTWTLALQQTLPHNLLMEAGIHRHQGHRPRSARRAQSSCRPTRPLSATANQLPMPPASLTRPTTPIPSTTPARCGSPGASPAACRPWRCTPSRNPSTTLPASPAAPAAPWSRTPTISAPSAACPASTSGTTSRSLTCFRRRWASTDCCATAAGRPRPSPAGR